MTKKRYRSPVVPKGAEDEIMRYAQQSHLKALDVVSELIEANQAMHRWMIRAWMLLESENMESAMPWPQLPDEAIHQMRIIGRLLNKQAEERRKTQAKAKAKTGSPLHRALVMAVPKLDPRIHRVTDKPFRLPEREKKENGEE